MLPRRRLLQSALAGLAISARPTRSSAQRPFGDADIPRLRALARLVLPGELSADALGRAVDQFVRWTRDYRPGAERDHGYGVTGVRVLPASPVIRYVAELDDLDRRAGGSLSGATPDDARRIVIDAIEAANVRDLPPRPNGGHVATDLMSHFFRGASATDLAYKRIIGRDACRDLQGSEARPAPLQASERL
jgi:hypothetical protein